MIIADEMKRWNSMESTVRFESDNYFDGYTFYLVAYDPQGRYYQQSLKVKQNLDPVLDDSYWEFLTENLFEQADILVDKVKRG